MTEFMRALNPATTRKKEKRQNVCHLSHLSSCVAVTNALYHSLDALEASVNVLSMRVGRQGSPQPSDALVA